MTKPYISVVSNEDFVKDYLDDHYPFEETKVTRSLNGVGNIHLSPAAHSDPRLAYQEIDEKLKGCLK